MLVNDGRVSKDQLQEAIYNQVIFGGRLGTNLLEFGYIDEESLGQISSPAAPREDRSPAGFGGD